MGIVEKVMLRQYMPDPSYAKELLNWEAELGLKEMVTSVWKWQNNISRKCCGGGCCNHKNKKL